MCLTPVDDSSVQRAVARGPNFSNLKNLQDKEILEADKEKGEIKIFGTRDDSSCLIELLKPIICLVQNDLQYEDYERPLSQQFESVNVVIGSGGEVTQVLMPDEYRSVFIEKAGKNTNEATVRQKLCQFGVIKECKIFKDSKSNRWGRVTFETSDQAKQAVAATKDDKCMVAVAEKRVLMQESTTEFKAKITWCRRISKDHAYVDLASEQLPILLSHSPILIDKCQVRVQLHRMSESTCTVCLNELSAETQERDITAAVLQALGPHTDSHVIHKVIVVREKVNTTPEMLNLFRSRIEEAIKKYATSGQFSVKVITPRPHSTMYVAYAHFHHLDECQKACSMLSQNFTMSTRKLLMEPNIVTQVFVKGNIFKVIEQDLRNSVEYLNHLEGTTSLRLNELRSGNYVIYINSSDAVQTARARSFLLAIIQGEVLDCKDNSSLKHLFTKSGKQFLAGLQSKLACLIVVDDRTMTVSIKGNSEVCTDVSLSISEYLGSISVDEWKDIYLRGPQKPAGVMKVLTAKYGSDLEMLKNEMELVSVNLDHHRHKVEVAGSSEAIKKTEATIEKMIAELASTLPLKTPADGRPKCVVCLQPVEYDQLYRLESCGHPYCNECIEQQLQVALDCKDFPIGCAQERCYMHFMWRDLSNFIKNGSVSLEQLVVSSVSAFVSRNHKDYRYCITPDCPVIYRVSAEGSMFKCCECQIRICTSCHIQFHDGLTCTMYKSQEEGGSTFLKQWMQLNENSKHCPCCQTPIEKTQGCDTMV
ncbi:ATP-dependent RNA helicase DEAH12, chloroplastic-like [Gigantopelta aegis]|uniref:ATP-dependent RNA helicase DEAH12, chloroplastic-like n=1 Tax=Gigantopelta aegis TaxID=1735272 RepID=UPI001B88BB45|nr:ATP-dependent RNA helicase DEAH12, chloroplastic-like [Gigantopelta aegis]